jgi:cytochrome c oxidase subunit 1
MTQRNETPTAAGFYERTGKYRWLVAEWMMSTDHKRIGVMYLMALLSFFSVGVVLGFIIRLSLLSPGWLMGQQTYNEFLPSTASSRYSSLSYRESRSPSVIFFFPSLSGRRTLPFRRSTAFPGGFM